ncbi:MAG: hypothetical protein WBJ13_05390 [Sedimentibacter sp.]
MLDIKIVNAEIIDVKNKTISIKDLGIKNGVIEKVGSNIGDATQIIDASDKYLSAGFVDIHMHEEDLKITSSNDYDILWLEFICNDFRLSRHLNLSLNGHLKISTNLFLQQHYHTGNLSYLKNS